VNPATGRPLKAVKGGQLTINLSKREQKLPWPIRPYEAGTNEITLIIDGLNPSQDILLDDYGTQLPITPGGQCTYSRGFTVYSVIEYLVIWLALIAALGAVAEIASALRLFGVI
jgi:hypothetical protein